MSRDSIKDLRSVFITHRFCKPTVPGKLNGQFLRLHLPGTVIRSPDLKRTFLIVN